MDARIVNQRAANYYKEKMVGTRYKHFKGGIYIVTDVAVHSETAEPMVVYKTFNDLSLVWVRPLEMFLSEVDHKKYPDVTQKLRFEPLTNVDGGDTDGM